MAVVHSHWLALSEAYLTCIYARKCVSRAGLNWHIGNLVSAIIVNNPLTSIQKICISSISFTNELHFTTKDDEICSAQIRRFLSVFGTTKRVFFRFSVASNCIQVFYTSDLNRTKRAVPIPSDYTTTRHRNDMVHVFINRVARWLRFTLVQLRNNLQLIKYILPNDPSIQEQTKEKIHGHKTECRNSHWLIDV